MGSGVDCGGYWKDIIELKKGRWDNIKPYNREESGRGGHKWSLQYVLLIFSTFLFKIFTHEYWQNNIENPSTHLLIHIHISLQWMYPYNDNPIILFYFYLRV